MKFYLFLLLAILPFPALATPQAPERLIIDGDTAHFDLYPLEEFRQSNNEIDNTLSNIFPASSSACWRGYIGTWKITNSKLYLVALHRSETGEEVKLSEVFAGTHISENGLFADWYSKHIKTDIGRRLGYEEGNIIYSGSISCDVKNGNVMNIHKDFRPDWEINAIEARIQVAKDTMICFIAEEMPVLKTESGHFEIEEIPNYLSSNKTLAEYQTYCEGKVYIALLIEKDGTLSRTRILKSNGSQCEQFVMDAVDGMTEWAPGRTNGLPVRVEVVIRFGIPPANTPVGYYSL